MTKIGKVHARRSARGAINDSQIAIDRSVIFDRLYTSHNTNKNFRQLNLQFYWKKKKKKKKKKKTEIVYK